MTQLHEEISGKHDPGVPLPVVKVFGTLQSIQESEIKEHYTLVSFRAFVGCEKCWAIRIKIRQAGFPVGT